MQQYIARRLLLLFPTLLGVALLVFLIMRIAPGDIAVLILGIGEGGVDPKALATLRHKLGLDQPLWVQFVQWLWGAVRFQFGESLWGGGDIAAEILRRLPLTGQVAIMGIVISLLIAIPAGVISAVRQNSWLDYFFRVFSIAGLAMPSFWLGLLIILFLVKAFRWVPPLEYQSPFEDLSVNFQQVICPALVVGYRNAAITTRMTRSCLLEVMREDYIRTAWAKGLRERVIIYKHALKNALMPVVTIVGMEFAFLFGGMVVVETVFTMPGLGRFVVDSILHRDYPTIQAIVLLMGFIVVFVNLAVDVLYGWLDPRVRYQ